MKKKLFNRGHSIGRKQRIPAEAKLYAVLDASVVPWQELQDVLKESVAAGVRIVQLRSKNGRARDILDFLKKARFVTKGRALLLVNDRVDLCLASGVDGVHLGQDDMPLATARRILGRRAVIGMSCQTLEQARHAQRSGADYLGFGSVFKTKTKPDREPMALDMIRFVSMHIRIPVFFIGGITTDNVGRVIDAGGRRVAVTRALCEAKDVGITAKRFLSLLG